MKGMIKWGCMGIRRLEEIVALSVCKDVSSGQNNSHPFQRQNILASSPDNPTSIFSIRVWDQDPMVSIRCGGGQGFSGVIHGNTSSWSGYLWIEILSYLPIDNQHTTTGNCNKHLYSRVRRTQGRQEAYGTYSHTAVFKSRWIILTIPSTLGTENII